MLMLIKMRIRKKEWKIIIEYREAVVKQDWRINILLENIK